MVVHFSCGAASAVCVLLALMECKESGEELEVLYANPGSEEPDNQRFLKDMENLCKIKVTTVKSTKYKDIFDVFTQKGGDGRFYFGSSFGAPCTFEMKKIPLRDYLQDRLIEDTHVFGYCFGEEKRHNRFLKNNPEVTLRSTLIEEKLSKVDCLYIIKRLGIKLPNMYLLGYSNANCPGCVKIGRTDYWAAIRRDFPDVFKWYAEAERANRTAERPDGFSICRKSKNGKYVPIYLDEIPKNARIQRNISFSCGYTCGSDDMETEVINMTGKVSKKAKEVLGDVFCFLGKEPSKDIKVEMKKNKKKLF